MQGHRNVRWRHLSDSELKSTESKTRDGVEEAQQAATDSKLAPTPATSIVEALRTLVHGFYLPPPPKQRLWPSFLFVLVWYLLCAVFGPQATFRSPAARYAFHTANYLCFVVLFSYCVVLQHWSSISDAEGSYGSRTVSL